VGLSPGLLLAQTQEGVAGMTKEPLGSLLDNLRSAQRINHRSSTQPQQQQQPNINIIIIIIIVIIVSASSQTTRPPPLNKTRIDTAATPHTSTNETREKFGKEEIYECGSRVWSTSGSDE